MVTYYEGTGKYKVSYGGPQSDSSATIELAIAQNNVANELSRANDIKMLELEIRKKELKNVSK